MLKLPKYFHSKLGDWSLAWMDHQPGVRDDSSRVGSVVGSAWKRERLGRGPMEQCSFHLVPHLKNVQQMLTIKGDSYRAKSFSFGPTFWGMLSKCYYKPWVHFLGISCNTWNLPQEAEMMSRLVHTVND